MAKIKNNIFSAVCMIMMNLTCISSNAQNSLTIDSIYENPSELLLRTKKIELDTNLNIQPLKQLFKKWIVMNFKDINSILELETDDQITIKFIMAYSYTGYMGMIATTENYYKLTALFKKGKIRFLLFDAGNAYIPATSSSPAYPAHSFNQTMYFKNKTSIQDKGANKIWFRAISAYMEKNRNFMFQLEKEFLNRESSLLNNNW